MKQLFSLGAMTLMRSACCVGAGALVAFTSTENMARLAKLSALITAAAFIAWLFMPERLLSLLTAIFFMLGLGGCAAFAYTFMLNNTERLLGAAGSSLFFAETFDSRPRGLGLRHGAQRGMKKTENTPDYHLCVFSVFFDIYRPQRLTSYSRGTCPPAVPSFRKAYD